VRASREPSGIVTPFPVPVWSPGKGPRLP
jgi:hypothetical protein